VPYLSAWCSTKHSLPFVGLLTCFIYVSGWVGEERNILSKEAIENLAGYKFIMIIIIVSGMPCWNGKQEQSCPLTVTVSVSIICFMILFVFILLYIHL
jgi:hypothetical protein